LNGELKAFRPNLKAQALTRGRSNAPTGVVGLSTLLAWIAIAGCDRADRQVDEAEAGLACEVGVTRVASLGSRDDPDGIRGERELQVVSLGEWGWLVLEPLATDVLRYDVDGRFGGMLGRRGRGPGELWRPMSLVHGQDGSVWVSDQQRRWTRFNPEGGLEETVVIPGPLAFDGITTEGEAFKLHLAVTMNVSGSFDSGSFFVHRWGSQGEPLEPAGPGVELLRGAPRVGRAASPHLLMHVSDSTWLIVGNFDTWGPTSGFPGSPGVQRWKGRRSEVLVGPEELHAALEAAGRHRRAGYELLMRAIGPASTPHRFWVYGALKGEGMAPGLEPPAGTEGTIRTSPTVRNQMFDGVAWEVGYDGSVHRAVRLPSVPDGVVGPDTWFSIDESVETGHRPVTVHRLGPCSIGHMSSTAEQRPPSDAGPVPAR
jgi:hypothetical protein